MSEQKIEVGDVFTHVATGSYEYTAVEVNGDYIIDNTGDSNFAGFCRLVRKADPYHGITLPKPPAGYRLARWGEDVPEKSLWWDGDEQGKNGTWDNDWCWSGWPWNQWKGYDAWLCIFAIPLNQPSVSDEFRKAAEIEANTPINIPLASVECVSPPNPIDGSWNAFLQPGCKWVRANWALQPTDFRIMQPSGEHVTAEQQGRAWSIALTDHTWQRPQLLDTDLLCLMKCIKTAVHNLPESDKQKFIFEMLQVQSQAGKLLSEICERAEAAAKALNEDEQQGGAK